MKKNIIIGIIIIAVGIILIGNEANLWDFNLFFDGWWTIFIIVPSIIALTQKQIKSGLIGLSIATFLILTTYDIIGWNLLLPIAIIVVGILLIIPNRKKSKKQNTNNQFYDDGKHKTKKYTAIFSGSSDKINGELNNISITSVFGGVDLDLRNATINHNVEIDCFCLFGGVDIIAPDNVYFEVVGTPIFGGIDNKTVTTSNKKIIFKCTCLFGGVDIK